MSQNGNESPTVGSVNTQDGIKDLSNFLPLKLLSESSQKKTICVLGNFAGKEGKVILFLEKSPFSEDNLKELCTENSVLENLFLNDIYGSYICLPDVKLNGIKTTVIYPATEQHIAKYEEKPFHIVKETPDLYQSVTLPQILKEKFSLQWVYNILEHKKESDRIVFEDSDPEKGFILLPDLKWDGTQVENLHLIVITHKRDITSLRDLTSEHLPLLRNILVKASEAIQEKYNLPSNKLRIFVHYQPTFYHFHVHFTNLKFDAPGIFVGRAHLLDTIINNIELMGDYYQKATLPFIIKEGEGLFSALEEIEISKKKIKIG